MSLLSEPKTWETGVPGKPDLDSQPGKNIPSEALLSGLSQQIRRLEKEVAGVRRRLWIERGAWCLAILLGAGAWAIPNLMPGVWALSVNGRPIVAMRDKAAVEALLTEMKREKSRDAALLAYLDGVEIRRMDPARVEITDARTAAERLEEAAAEMAPRGVIYVSGQPLAALPDAGAAAEVLEDLKRRVPSAPDGTPPEFKEPVEIRTEPAASKLWADRTEALGILTGAGGGGVHKVRSGESAWSIARANGLSLQDLKTANPGVNLERLQLGQELRLGSGKPAPLTVVSTNTVTETVEIPFRESTTPRPLMWAGKRVIKQHGVPGRERVTFRVTYENGKPVRKEALQRTRIQSPIEQIVAVGTKPRR